MVYQVCPDGFKLVGGVCVPQSNEALMKWKSRQGKKREPQPEPEPDVDPDTPEPDVDPDTPEPDVEPEPDPEFWDNLNEAIAKDKEKEEAEAGVGLVSTTAGLTSVGYGLTKKAQRAMRQQNKQKIDEITEDDAVEDIELTERQSMNLFEDVAEEEAEEGDALLGDIQMTETTGLRQRTGAAGASEESTVLEGETEDIIIGDELAEEEMFLTTEELLSIGGGAGLIVGGLYIGADLIDSDFGKIQPLQSQEEAEMSGRDNVEVAQESLNAMGNIFGD